MPEVKGSIASRLFGAGFAGLMVVFAGAAQANELAAPDGPVILVVSGDIARTTDGKKAKFDRETLQALGTHNLTTSTTWTDGPQNFEGPRLSAVLDAVGAEGNTLEAVALNNYSVELEVDELRRYPVLLASRMNGKTLSVRDKGPLWIVYPRDQYPQVSQDHKWIWQVKELRIK